MRNILHFLLLALLSCALACHKPDAKLVESMETTRAYYLDYYPNTELVGATINQLLLKMTDMPADFAQNMLIQDLKKNTLALRETYSKAYTLYANSLNSLAELKKLHEGGKKSKAEAETEYKTLEATLIEAKKRVDQSGQDLQHNEATYDEMFGQYQKDPVGFVQHSLVKSLGDPNAPRQSLEASPDGRGFVKPK